MIGLSAVALLLVVALPHAAASETFGADPLQQSDVQDTSITSSCNNSCVWSQITAPDSPQIVAPGDGVIVSWSTWVSYNSDDLGHLKLYVYRGAVMVAREPGAAHVVGPFPTFGNAMLTYPTRIPVEEGDRLGIWAPDIGVISEHGELTGFSADVYGYQPFVRPASQYPDPALPAAADYHLLANDQPGSFDGPEIQVQAELEPDADGDGYGDESQDDCPDNPSTQEPPCDVANEPPETTITDHPKKVVKSDKQKVPAEFSFESNELNSTFKCKVDDKRYSGCSSPETVKVSRGRHTFRVRARDDEGEPDPDPAVFSWTLKKP